MMETTPPPSEGTPLDPGLRALCGIAAYYRIGADPVQLTRELALGARQANEADIIRAAKLIGLKARLVEKVTAERLATLPTPAIAIRRGFAGLLIRSATLHTRRRSKTLRATSGRRCLSPGESVAQASIRASSACVGSCRPSGAIAVRLAMCWPHRCSCRLSASRRRCSFRSSSTRC